MKNLAFIAMMGIVCLFASCSDDDTPSDANENFITSFAFTLGNGEKFDATINGNVITMTVPYNVTLDGAKADVAYTQSAKIMPNPATVTDWNAEQVFVVTSYNGEKNEYTYNIVRSEITHSGDVVLATMDDMDNFFASATSVIDGNLIIGNDDDNAGDITNFAGLANLKSVKGSVILKSSIKTSDFTGFDNLKEIGGLQIGDKDNYSSAEIEMVTMRNLVTVNGNVSIMNDAVSIVEFPALTEVKGDVAVDSKVLKNLEMPNLERIEAKLLLSKKIPYTAGVVRGEITKIEFPKLEEVGDTLGIYYLSPLKEISFPVLKVSGSIQMPCISFAVDKISIPSVELIKGGVTIIGIEGKATVTGEYNKVLEHIDSFQNLQELQGVFKISTFPGLLSLPDFKALKRVGGFCIDSFKPEVQENLDFSKYEFVEYNGVAPSIEVPSGCKVLKTADNLPNVDLTLQSNTTINIHTIHSLTYLKSLESIDVPTLEYVYGNLYVSGSKMRQSFSMPNLKGVDGFMHFYTVMQVVSLDFQSLEKVGGQLFLEGIYNNAKATYNFSQLKTVCCSENPAYTTFKVTQASSKDIPHGSLHVRSSVKTFDFPVLERVGGKGITLEQLAPFSCPRLKQIDGFLYVYNSSRLTEIELPVLEKLSEVKFVNDNKFADFSVFSKFINDGQITKEKWSVTDCAYNPSYEDMKAGRYKPAE